MTVSANHQDLINIIEAWCIKQIDLDSSVFLIDAIDSVGANKPPTVRGYRPDVLCMSISGFYTLIGEAKTASDLRASHSRAQLTAFLRALHEQDGGTLIVAVPWGSERTAASLLRHLQNCLGETRQRWLVLSTAPSDG